MVEILLRDLQNGNKVSLSAENMDKLVSFKALLSVTPIKWPMALKTATDWNSFSNYVWISAWQIETLLRWFDMSWSVSIQQIAASFE